MNRTVSGPYMGPHAVFTNEELQAIRRLMDLRSRTDPLLASALRKIDASLNAFPEFKLPLNGTAE